jgi:hypothetical protein
VCVYVRTYVCMYVCTYVCMYVYTYVLYIDNDNNFMLGGKNDLLYLPVLVLIIDTLSDLSDLCINWRRGWVVSKLICEIFCLAVMM